MPISNLSIQRRRINELKKLGFKEIQPEGFDNYTDFTFSVEKFTNEDTLRLARMEFYVNSIETFSGTRSGERFAGMVASVHKDPIEKKRLFKKQQLVGIQN